MGNTQALPVQYAASIGAYKDWLSENKFAANPSVGTSLQDVWNNGGTEVYLTSAEQMNIASSDGADKGTPTAGTGARTLRIFGLDANYDQIDEVVTLDGTNNVLTANSYLRVHRMIVTSAGSGGQNAGNITATAASAGSIHANIAIGDNQTLKSQYTVPNGYYMLANEFFASCAKNDQAEFRVEVRPLNEVFQVKFIFQLFQQAKEFMFTPSRLIAPKTDVRVRAKNIGGTTISVTASYDFYLVPEAQVNI